MAATPLKRFWPQGRCEGTNKQGQRCGCRKVYLTKKHGRKLCRFHGGAFYNRLERGLPPPKTGPKTAAGKARIIAAAMKNLRLTPSWRKRLVQDNR